MKIPIVSVIIPAYNCAIYIEKALQSIIEQNVALEVLIINDGSTDNLDKAVEKYLEYDNFNYLKNDTNLGVAASRNIGVLHAKGKYIAYLDADDWWAKNKLEKQLLLIEQKNAIMCYTARKLVKSDGSDLNKIIHVPGQVDYEMLLRHNCIACSSVLILKEVAEKIPMTHDNYHEDYINWLQILQKHGIAYGVDEPLLIYRMSENGKSRNRLKSARMTYGVYRVLGKKRTKAFGLLLSHLLHGLKKYM